MCDRGIRQGHRILRRSDGQALLLKVAYPRLRLGGHLKPAIKGHFKTGH